MVFIANTVSDSLHVTIKRYLRDIDAYKQLRFNFKTARRPHPPLFKLHVSCGTSRAPDGKVEAENC